jgi:c-di-GMP-binding flagellar brake protein YcgR
MMEHRLDYRIQTPVNVTIHTNRGDTYKTRANNLSRGGVRVEMESVWEIKENKLVLMEFTEEDLSAKIPALVLQIAGKTASLMFIEHSPELHSFLSHRNR